MLCACTSAFNLIECIQTQQKNVSVSDSVNISPTSYTIIYSDFSTGSICGLSTILASVCQDEFQCDSFDFSSPCSSNGYTSVSVFATNIFGRGSFSQPLIFRIKPDKSDNCSKCINIYI